MEEQKGVEEEKDSGLASLNLIYKVLPRQIRNGIRSTDDREN
jgi:hypothetical protein